MLIFTLLAAVMGLAVCISEQQNSAVADGAVRRNSYDGTSREITVTAYPAESGTGGNASEEGTAGDYGSYVIEVGERQYTDQEAAELADELFTLLPEKIRGDNPDLQHVSGDLSLMSRLRGYPFTISWEPEDYSLIDSEGKLVSALYGAESLPTKLTAKLLYNRHLYVHEYAVILVPAAETKEQRRRRLIEESLEKSESDQATEEELQLPAEIDGEQLIWKEKKSSTPLLIFALILSGGLMNGILSGQKKRKKEEERRQALRLEYPQLISRMVLFLGAGMSVRNVFFKLGSDYQEQRSAGAGRKVCCEEILQVCHELDSGISETAAYGHFGQRCGVRQYTRLSALLTQNLRKGNSELLHVLQEEAGNASDERRQMARQLGEEAGTKLLLPMVMMMAVTMVMIVIPAFMGFS